MLEKVILGIGITLFFLIGFPYEYDCLRYVTIGQVFDRLKSHFFGWLTWSVLFLVFSFFGDSPAVKSYDSFVNSFFQFFPAGVWYVIAVAIATWILRGQKLEWPKWTRKQWLLLNGFVAIGTVFFLVIADALPRALVAFIVVSVWKGLDVYGELIEDGKRNVRIGATVADLQAD